MPFKQEQSHLHQSLLIGAVNIINEQWTWLKTSEHGQRNSEESLGTVNVAEDQWTWLKNSEHGWRTVNVAEDMWTWLKNNACGWRTVNIIKEQWTWYRNNIFIAIKTNFKNMCFWLPSLHENSTNHDFFVSNNYENFATRFHLVLLITKKEAILLCVEMF